MSLDLFNNLINNIKENITLYRSQFPANGSSNGQFYNVKKFENEEITNVKISKNDIPEEYQMIDGKYEKIE